MPMSPRLAEAFDTDPELALKLRGALGAYIEQAGIDPDPTRVPRLWTALLLRHGGGDEALTAAVKELRARANDDPEGFKDAVTELAAGVTLEQTRDALLAEVGARLEQTGIDASARAAALGRLAAGEASADAVIDLARLLEQAGREPAVLKALLLAPEDAADTRLSEQLHKLGLGHWLGQVTHWLDRSADTAERAKQLDTLLADLAALNPADAEALLRERVLGLPADPSPPADPLARCREEIAAKLGALDGYPALQAGLELLYRRGAWARERDGGAGLFQPGGLITAHELNDLLAAFLHQLVHHGHRGGEHLLDGAPLGGDAIASAAIDTRHLAPRAVDQARLADAAVGAEQLRAGAVQTGHLAAGAVGAEQLADEAVGLAALAAEVRAALQRDGGPSTRGYLMFLDPAALLTASDADKDEAEDEDGLPSQFQGFVTADKVLELAVPVIGLAESGELQIVSDYGMAADRLAGRVVPGAGGGIAGVGGIAVASTTVYADARAGTREVATAAVRPASTSAAATAGVAAGAKPAAAVRSTTPRIAAASRPGMDFGDVALDQSIARGSALGAAVDTAYARIVRGLATELAHKPPGWQLSADLLRRRRQAITIDPSGLALAGHWACGPITLHPGLGGNGLLNDFRDLQYSLGSPPSGKARAAARALIYSYGMPVEMIDDAALRTRAFGNAAFVELLNRPERNGFGYTTADDANIRAVYRLAAAGDLPPRVRVLFEQPYRHCAYAVVATPDLPPPAPSGTHKDLKQVYRSQTPLVVSRARQYVEIAFHPFDEQSNRVSFSLAIHGELES
jgi:hypothetical protein